MQETVVSCPYCGEMISVLVDASDAGHEYFEDCSVCCSPILFQLSQDNTAEISLILKRDDE